MFYVEIQYKVDVSGIIKVEPLSINPNNSDISNVQLLFEQTNSNFDILFIKFYFNKNINNLQEAETITRPFLTDFINLLIYKFNATFKNPSVHSYIIGKDSLIATGAITLYNQQNYKITEDDSKWLSEKIINQSLVNRLKLNPYFIQYKSILAIEDNISRFLLLYGLLYEIKTDQKSVDKYIENEEKNVIKLQTTKVHQKTKVRLTYDETIYTWWRNQAQHMQRSTDIVEVAKQFNTLESSLKDLVFKAIKSQI